MPEREHEAAQEPAAQRGARAAAGPATPAALALQRQAGNRAMGRMLARMETADAVETLSQTLATGVMGAERHVTDTLAAFSADTSGFDSVAKDYEKKVETPLPPDLGKVPGATDRIPLGWYPGISE